MNLNSLFKADFLASASRSRLLMACLLVAVVDVVIFYALNQQSHSLALAHLASFLGASIVGLIVVKIKKNEKKMLKIFIFLFNK